MDDSTSQSSAIKVQHDASVRGADGNLQGFGMEELIPVRLRKQDKTPFGSRLNLIIPCISQGNTFGGVATALRFFRRLSDEFEFSRIIVSHEDESTFEPELWDGWRVTKSETERRSLIFLGDHKTSLPIAAGDLFVATFWSTALYAKTLVATQRQLFNETHRRFIYLIQDYEPGFYPFSAGAALAMKSYEDSSSTIAVFNNGLLARYFDHEGLHFSSSYVFEPGLNPELREVYAATRGVKKERVILVYARTLMQRNAFSLAVESLKLWSESFPAAAQWTVISAGDAHPKIRLGEGVTIDSAGKLSMDEYGSLLAKTWVGLFFQFTPHPGYVSQEMAEFGSYVITNRFAGRDTSAMSPGIAASHDLMPATIAEKLGSFCEKYRPDRTSAFDNPRPVFRQTKEEFPFVETLVKEWIGAIPESA
jgi:O-antigen biosynthesis protein